MTPKGTSMSEKLQLLSPRAQSNNVFPSFSRRGRFTATNFSKRGRQLETTVGIPGGPPRILFANAAPPLPVGSRSVHPYRVLASWEKTPGVMTVRVLVFPNATPSRSV